MRQATNICCMLIAVIMFLGCEGAVSRGILKDPAYPGKCAVEGLILNAGQTAPHPRFCQQIFCGRDSEVEMHTCGTFVVGGSLKFGKFENPHADYPHCCHQVKINVPNTVIYT